MSLEPAPHYGLEFDIDDLLPPEHADADVEMVEFRTPRRSKSDDPFARFLQ